MLWYAKDLLAHKPTPPTPVLLSHFGLLIVTACCVAPDELIRQVTINSPERGLLMLRVRDEIRMTIDAYKTLYQSSVTFGVRKQLQAEQGMADMEAQISGLTESKQDLENQVLELRNKVEVSVALTR